MKIPRVTVIIPTYNSAKSLAWTLRSVQTQDFRDFEVRVIGDGCTDHSASVVDSMNDPRFSWHNLSVNSGSQAQPNNHALTHARGAYIAYLGHDDLWFPWHLSELVSTLETHQADFVFSLCACIGPEGIRDPVGPPLVVEKNLFNHFSPPSSWMHRKDLIDRCGLWRIDRENLICNVDTEYWRRALKHTQRFYFCPSLTILKFPSPWWRSYQLKSSYPQEPFLDRLFKSPKELHAHTLTQIAIYSLARLPRKGVSWKQRLLSLIDLYGRERFPFFALFRWRFQKKWKQAWLKRGLYQSQ